MCGLPWGELYEKYHKTPYDPAQVAAKQRELYEDYYVYSFHSAERAAYSLR